VRVVLLQPVQEPAHLALYFPPLSRQ
jgi:hypothetical protein